MKFVLCLLMLCLSTALAMADGLEVTSEDVTIRFPDAAEPDNVWYSIEITNVSYWQEAVGMHNPKAKMGVQTWEGLLQQDQPELGKVRFTINIISLPNITGKTALARRMELCFRVRQVIGDILMVIGPFSAANYVDIIGKPGQPAQQ